MLKACGQGKESRQSLSLHDGNGYIEYSILQTYECISNRRYNESSSDNKRRIGKKRAKKRMTLTLKMTTKILRLMRKIWHERRKRGMRRRLVFLYLFPETWRLAQPPSVLAATHAAQPVKERMEPRQEPAAEGEHDSVVGETSGRAVS